MNKTIDLSIFKRSKFRMKFKLDSGDQMHIAKKGMHVITNHTKHFVLTRLASPHPQNDGKQTPFKGHPVFKAQHATATCCRGCLQKWHSIPKGKELVEEEIDYVVKVIVAWINSNVSKRSRERGNAFTDKQLSLFDF